MKPKILVILGPTATGKSGLGVLIAKKFNGEIVSADSRQVYTGLDIGTGKITQEEMGGVPHHLLDVANPSKNFDISKYKKLAEEKIDDILSRAKLPIVVGGTGFYIEVLVNGLVLPEVLPNKELREKLEKEPAEELLEKLKKLDPKRAGSVNRTSKRHLIRALEIAEALGRVPELKKKPKYEALQIGLDLEDTELKKKIHNRLIERIDAGMIEEGKRLEKEIGLERMIQFGLEYKYLAELLKKSPRPSAPDISAMVVSLETAIWQYVKRQRTWFKRDKRIKWFRPDEFERMLALIQAFLFSSSSSLVKATTRRANGN